MTSILKLQILWEAFTGNNFTHFIKENWFVCFCFDSSFSASVCKESVYLDFSLQKISIGY